MRGMLGSDESECGPVTLAVWRAIGTPSTTASSLRTVRMMKMSESSFGRETDQFTIGTRAHQYAAPKLSYRVALFEMRRMRSSASRRQRHQNQCRQHHAIDL